MMDSSMDCYGATQSKRQKENQIYKRERLLGSGSFGKAYLVREIKTDQLFVIKQISMSDMSPTQQQSALIQVKILKALSHPNIVKFKEVYRTSKHRLNIVMEYANGGDLGARLKQAKKAKTYFDEKLILDWFTQICLAVKHCHDRKIIHRDLKAQNVFLTQDNTVKIGDFGVSRVLEKTAMHAKTLVGTPYYCSPEILQNKPYSFQTDIWSLGILLYEMCALQHPFRANNLQFLALKIVKGMYEQIPSQYSYQLKLLIKSLLHTDSSRRPNINKILTSKIISKRISSFLTQSKQIDEFSHTVIHNKQILQAKPAKIPKQPKKNNDGSSFIIPPPNLKKIEQQNGSQQNKSDICGSNMQLDVSQQFATKSRPYTPQATGRVQKKKASANNFFNKKVVAKQPSNEFFSKNQQQQHSLNDLITCRATVLQQKTKLPKVATNPSFYHEKNPNSNKTPKIGVKNIAPTNGSGGPTDHRFVKKSINKKEQTQVIKVSKWVRPQSLNKAQSEHQISSRQKNKNMYENGQKPTKPLLNIHSQEIERRNIISESAGENSSNVRDEVTGNKKQEEQGKAKPQTAALLKKANSIKKIPATGGNKKVGATPLSSQRKKSNHANNSNTNKGTHKASVKKISNAAQGPIQIVSEEAKRKKQQESKKINKMNNPSSGTVVNGKKNQPRKGSTSSNIRTGSAVPKKVVNTATTKTKGITITRNTSATTTPNEKLSKQKLTQPPKLEYANDQIAAQITQQDQAHLNQVNDQDDDQMDGFKQEQLVQNEQNEQKENVSFYDGNQQLQENQSYYQQEIFQQYVDEDQNQQNQHEAQQNQYDDGQDQNDEDNKQNNAADQFHDKVKGAQLQQQQYLNSSLTLSDSARPVRDNLKNNLSKKVSGEGAAQGCNMNDQPQSSQPHPPHNQNYNKMLNELECIQRMVAQANGLIDNIPMFGDELLEFNNNQNTLLTQRGRTEKEGKDNKVVDNDSEDNIREDDSQLDSVVNDHDDHDIDQQGENQDPNISGSKGSTNSQPQSHYQTAINNFKCLSDQGQLQSLRMNLQDLFGEEDIIFIHSKISKIMDKEGLNFDQRLVVRQILSQKQSINKSLLEKYFSLIVTVISMQQQIVASDEVAEQQQQL